MREIIKTFADLFESRTIGEGSDAKTKTFIKEDLKDTPEAEAVRNTLFETCDSIAAIDWLYEKAAEICDTFTQYNADDWEAMRENIGEIADGLVDVYNADRTEWLNLSLDFAAWVDDARREFGSEDADTFDQIGRGQYMLISELAEALLTKMEAFDESEEEK